ncbi:MAG TPA: Ig-like domain-containing protein [Membranihabitans sp.]|nr:Ig-like domain-containing protein [Membranihabitans sp.]
MRHRLCHILSLCSVLVLLQVLTQCASPGSIQGGPRDETPPSVDSLRSTPTPQTNFSPQEIMISFDEWVKLEDPFNQIFISPPLEQRPEYNLKGRSLIINFHEEEELQENTTYIINLGTSVQDITESNPVEDFQFVFSTGEWLDSLGFDGVITDALTGEPAENVSVMLYRNFADSAIATLPPSYFVRTNKEGEFRFNYLRADTFQLVAYVDDDLDYRHSAETEPLGFLPEPISTTEINDSTLSFTISLGTPPVYLDRVDSATLGLLVLTMSDPITDTARLRVQSEGIRHVDRINNQLRMYYTPDSLPVQVIVENIRGFRDTVVVRSAEKKEFDAENLSVTRVNPTFLPSEAMELMTNWPIEAVNPDIITLTKEDDDELIPLDTAILGFNTVRLKYPWQADTNYHLIFYPGAIQFPEDIAHDTIEYKFKPVSLESLASLIVNLHGDTATAAPFQFLLQLKQNNNIVAEKITRDPNSSHTFSALKPGSYELEIIWDENDNGIWDPARYPGRLPAERLQKIEVPTLRVNWVQELEVELRK